MDQHGIGGRAGDAAGHAANMGFYGVDKLATRQDDEVRTDFTNAQGPLGDGELTPLLWLLPFHLEKTVHVHPVWHGEDEKGCGLVLNQLAQQQYFADDAGQGGRRDAVSVFKRLDRGDVVGGGTNAADAGHDDRHLFRRGSQHKMPETAHFDRLKMGG